MSAGNRDVGLKQVNVSIAVKSREHIGMQKRCFRFEKCLAVQATSLHRQINS